MEEIAYTNYKMAEEYISEHVMQYAGKTFLTENESRYSFTRNGEFIGRQSGEGGDIERVAGITPEEYFEAWSYLSTQDREGLNNFIKTKGQKAKEGLHLVLSLTEQEANLRDRVGFMSSEIKKVYND